MNSVVSRHIRYLIRSSLYISQLGLGLGKPSRPTGAISTGGTQIVPSHALPKVETSIRIAVSHTPPSCLLIVSSQVSNFRNRSSSI